MDQLSGWRWLISGVWTGAVAVACVLAITRSTRHSLTDAVATVKAEYDHLQSRLDQLSERMDQQEVQLLKIILHLFPDEAS